MRPVLYLDTEINEATPFKTMGIGTLHDVVSCRVTEEINGEYDLEMEYPVDGVWFSEIQNNRIITVEPHDGASRQPFQIYKITRPIDGTIRVLASHISFQLSRVVVTPFTASSASDFITKLTAGIIGTHKFSFSTSLSATGTYTFATSKSAREIMIEAAGVFGGEWEFDGFSCTLKARRGADNAASIRYSANMTGIKAEFNIDECYSYILPYYKNGDYYRQANSRRVTSHTGDWAEERTLAVDVTEIIGPGLQSVTNTQLNTAGNTWLASNSVWEPEVAMEVEFAPLYQSAEYADRAITDRIAIGDTVRVLHDIMGIDVKTRVVRCEYDAVAERYNRVEIGAVMPYLDQGGRWSQEGGKR